MLSRLPFHTVGILPFLLGNILVRYSTTAFRWDVFFLALIGVILIMLTTYYAGEYWDIQEDTISGSHAPSSFSGGSQVIQRGLLPHTHALWASLLSMILALSIGVVLQFYFNTGFWTLPLGLVGLAGGFFYSARPIRWVSRGVGELWIALCYGWLPLISAYYIQQGPPPTLVYWIGLPIALTIVNVILLNEFPDYSADTQTGKRNLVVRVGQSGAALIYIILNVGSWIAMVLIGLHGAPGHTLLYYLPVFLLSLFTTSLMLKGAWKTPSTLTKLCGITLLINLGTTSSLVMSFIGG
jgi:1,4-dihydroxy-2-naphthoate octaprenyltransferase